MSNQDSQQSPIRLGIIGAGLAVKYLHWPALTELPGRFKIVAVCDIVSEARAETSARAEELNRKQYGESGPIAQDSDFRALLARPEVEAVLLSLPIHLNAEIILASAKAGKHIICEKPVAANLAQGRELVETLSHISASRKIVVEIAENYHYRQEVDEAKKWAFEEKLVGEPVLIAAQGTFRIDTTKGFASTPWRIDNQYKGGIVTDGGVHHAALLRHLGGEVEQLQAFAKQMNKTATSSLDTVIANLRFRNGVLGQLTYSGAITAPEGTQAECTIFGTEGTIKINRKEARLYRSNGGEEATEQKSFKADKTDYYMEFLNFYEAVRENKPVIATPEECLRDLEIIMAAFDSAEERKIILF